MSAPPYTRGVGAVRLNHPRLDLVRNIGVCPASPPTLVQWGHRSGATCQLESVGGDPRRLRPGSRIDIGEGPPEDLLAGQVGCSSQIS
jgi:hypothetical protein